MCFLRWAVVVMSVIPFGGAALAQPSFDCAKAKRAVEALICSSKDLSELDANLGKAYKRGSQSSSRRKGQAQWLVLRDAKCRVDDPKIAKEKKIACLKFEYTRRLSWLSQSASEYESEPIHYKEIRGSKAEHPNLRFLSTLAGLCLLYFDVYKDSELVPMQVVDELMCGVGAGDLVFKDVNFDGRADLLLLDAEASAMHNSYYSVFVFNPGSGNFERDETFPQGGSPEVDAQKKELRTHEYLGDAGNISIDSIYKYKNGRYTLVSETRSGRLSEYCANQLKCLPDDSRPKCLKLKGCVAGNGSGDFCSLLVSVTSLHDDAGKLTGARGRVVKNGSSKVVDLSTLCK